MPLRIDTFSNQTGGNALFKALGHPLGAERMAALIRRLAKAGPVAIYDPLGFLPTVAALHDLKKLKIAGVYVQDLGDLGQTRLGFPAQPVTDLKAAQARAVFVAAFDAQRFVDHIRHLLPDGAAVATLDEARLPDALLTNRQRYLDPLNFATNFAFFRDQDGVHTRLVTANYWSGYGAKSVKLWLALFDAAGKRMATWEEQVPDGLAGIAVDSAELRTRFDLPEFTGQMLIHVVGARGHDVVKYALDTYGANGAATLSCTHDANAWPSDLYAGLPAPRADERVVLWVQNSHCCPIPPRAVGLNLMGDDATAWLDREVPAFGSHPLDVAELLPRASWPQQIEIRAGKHFVRPRYEVVDKRAIEKHGPRRRIAHPNVERGDLKPDPNIAELGNLMGKGYLLPAPVLPLKDWRSVALPTPMATGQSELPIAAIVYDRDGRELARHRFGRLKRAQCAAIDAEEVLRKSGAALADWGHMELVYDMTEGGAADGWLHGLFRYERKQGGHAAETSFGAHIFNTVLTYRNEPQSYAGRAPGLSTRLFLRLGPAPFDTMCHLIYPASTPWHGRSATELVLYDGAGGEAAKKTIEIPCGGSLLWRYHDQFTAAERRRAGERACIVVRDTTCRLFGYHGLLAQDGRFSFDHMFGF